MIAKLLFYIVIFPLIVFNDARVEAQERLTVTLPQITPGQSAQLSRRGTMLDSRQLHCVNPGYGQCPGILSSLFYAN